MNWRGYRKEKVRTFSGFAELKGIKKGKDWNLQKLKKKKKACEGERILSKYSSFYPNLFLIDTIVKRKI